MEHILDRKSDIVFLTETWLTSDCNHVTSMVKTYGYELLHCRRKNRLKETGGGVGVILKQGIKQKVIKSKTYTSFEHIAQDIPNKQKIYHVDMYLQTVICFNRDIL